MWNYWPLKFPDKATCEAALFDSEGMPKYDNTDVIGIIYNQQGVASEGYHVNIAVIGDLDSSLISYKIPFPMYPKRVFFNQMDGVM